jgi:hypothetical protein
MRWPAQNFGAGRLIGGRHLVFHCLLCGDSCTFFRRR